MFNLVIRADESCPMPIDRYFEYTDSVSKTAFTLGNGSPDFNRMRSLPALVVREFDDSSTDLVRVGWFKSLNQLSTLTDFEQSPLIQPFEASRLLSHMTELQMVDFEKIRTHWAIKEGDLFHMLGNIVGSDARNSRFPLTPTDPKLISVMMPFTHAFDGVYAAIKHAVESCDLKCRRVDEIHTPTSIPDDICALIQESALVITDVSDSNLNVYFEWGLALGRDKPVVAICQQGQQPHPFDVNHIRRIEYSNNDQGRTDLQQQLQQSIQETLHVTTAM